MVVGEQPGDQEDHQGRLSVGPAGRLRDRAIADAGFVRADVFVTNAVKHFKFEQRGRRRLHNKTSVDEIARCRWWLDPEQAVVKPAVVVVLGATAARSLFGRAVTLARLRGEVLSGRDGSRVVVTIHPSYLLRLRDAESEAREYGGLVATCGSVHGWSRRPHDAQGRLIRAPRHALAAAGSRHRDRTMPV